MIEIRWLKERGLVSSYEDYLALPIGVVEDARIVMQAEQMKAKQDERLAARRR